MINTNSAMYVGLLTTCILDRCPGATVHVTRVLGATGGGYELTAMVKVGTGTEARSGVRVHVFRDSETATRSAGDVATAARVAGDEIGNTLASVR